MYVNSRVWGAFAGHRKVARLRVSSVPDELSVALRGCHRCVNACMSGSVVNRFEGPLVRTVLYKRSPFIIDHLQGLPCPVILQDGGGPGGRRGSPVLLFSRRVEDQEG